MSSCGRLQSRWNAPELTSGRAVEIGWCQVGNIGAASTRPPTTGPDTRALLRTTAAPGGRGRGGHHRQLASEFPAEHERGCPWSAGCRASPASALLDRAARRFLRGDRSEDRSVDGPAPGLQSNGRCARASPWRAPQPVAVPPEAAQAQTKATRTDVLDGPSGPVIRIDRPRYRYRHHDPRAAESHAEGRVGAAGRSRAPAPVRHVVIAGAGPGKFGRSGRVSWT